MRSLRRTVGCVVVGLALSGPVFQVDGEPAARESARPLGWAQAVVCGIKTALGLGCFEAAGIVAPKPPTAVGATPPPSTPSSGDHGPDIDPNG